MTHYVCQSHCRSKVQKWARMWLEFQCTLFWHINLYVIFLCGSKGFVIILYTWPSHTSMREKQRKPHRPVLTLSRSFLRARPSWLPICEDKRGIWAISSLVIPHRGQCLHWRAAAPTEDSFMAQDNAWLASALQLLGLEISLEEKNWHPILSIFKLERL